MKFILTVLLALSAQVYAKKNVCTVTINSKEEREIFRSKLDSRDFNFIELTDYSSDTTKKNNDWFQRACEAKVKCDVLVISGHFGGSFFGDTEYSLGLNELESNSCQNRCDGLLSHPKEVFLFGCNTLASKDLDHRTPEQYLEALIEHEVDATEAERIVAARYSPIGFSNSDRMRRVFEGVPLIYGFTSVGPSGKHVKSSLSKYLNEIGDYKKHLQTIEDGKSSNPVFLKNMTAYTTAIQNGIKKEESVHYAVKENSCKLSDESVSIDDRLTHAGNILQSSPHVYFPTVADFVSRHFGNYYMESEETAKRLIRISARLDLKEQVMKIADIGGFGPTLQMDLYQFSKTVLWISSDEYKNKVRILLNDLLSRPTLQNADIFCSIQDEYDVSEIKYSFRDLPSNFKFDNPFALKMLGCLDKVEDTKITQSAFNAAKKMNLEKLQVETLNAILDTISKLPGFNDEIADFILSFYPYQGRYENEINISFHALALRKVTAQRQLEIYKKARALPPGSNANYFTLIISASINDNENINPEVETLILTENYKECLKTQDFCYLTTFTGNKKVQNWMVKYLDFSKNPKFVEALTYKYNYTGNQQKQGFEATPELTIQILNSIFSSKALLNSYSALGFLETAEINATVLEKIRSIYENLYKTQPNSDQLAQLRHILFKNKDQIPDLKPYEIEGLKATQKCTTNGHSSSCYWKTY